MSSLKIAETFASQLLTSYHKGYAKCMFILIMARSDLTFINWIALMIIGLHVSLIGLAIREIIVVAAGFMFSLLIYFVHFWENSSGP